MRYLRTATAFALLTIASAHAATFTFTDQWTTGGQGNFRVSNESAQPLQSWKLEFDWNANITSAWNGVLQSHVGNHYIITNTSWNGALAVGASVDVGCVFNTTTPGVMPTNITFSAGGGGGGSTVTAPVITSALTARISVGQSFTYQITASNSPTGFSASGLPTGIAVNSTSGVISGALQVAGNYNIGISASNAGGSGTATLALTATQCASDGNNDGKVDGADLGLMLNQWGQPSPYDLNGDGNTDGADLGIMLAAWGPCVPTNNSGGYQLMPTVEQRKIVGYYPNWGIYQKNFPVTSIRGDRLNVINYAFLIPLDRTMPAAWNRVVSSYRGWTYTNYANYLQQPAGTTLSAGVGLFDEWADVKADNAAEALTMSPAYRAGSNFAQLQDLKAAYPKLRTMVSIGGWTLSTPFFSIARSAQKRADFAKSAVYVVSKYGFDGIDIDWEYPGGNGLEQSGIGDPSVDGANYVLLLQALRAELNRQTAIDGRTYYLTIAAPGGDVTIANMNPVAIASVVDWINIMSYDFHGGWDSYTGLNAPMVNIDPTPSSARWSVTQCVDIYLNGANGTGGVAPGKIVLGAPMYGRGWNNVQPGPNGNGLGQPGAEGTSPGLGETEFPYNSLFTSGVLSYNNGAFVGAAGFTRYWDTVAQVPYLYSSSAKKFITYDDPQSIGIKMNFANQKGLGGVMFWELSEDTTAPGTSLMDSMYEGMRLQNAP